MFDPASRYQNYENSEELAKYLRISAVFLGNSGAGFQILERHSQLTSVTLQNLKHFQECLTTTNNKVK